MPSLSRRTFLGSSLAALAATAFTRLPGPSPAPAPAAPAVGGFRIFAPDWTLDKRCDPAAFERAARIGLDGVQVDFGWPQDGGGRPPLLAEAKQDEIMAAAAQHGVLISSLALGAVNRTPYKSAPEGEQWVIDSIATMRRMKIRVVLLPFFNKGDLIGDPAGVEEVIRRLRRLAPRAEEAGVIFGIESWLKVPELERILDAVKSPAVQVYYDVGNMQKVGEDYAAAIRHFGQERICEVHLKDQDDLYGKGSMNFPAVRAALDDAGYRGWVGIEGLKMPLGIEQSVRYDLEYLRPIFPRAIR
jgi:sugar phosphate isomerase/epimerase